ncbi:hypothetical protein ACVILI_005982 [Mesorhizobium sp. USDA 4775]
MKILTERPAWDYPELWASVVNGAPISENTIRRRAAKLGFRVKKSRRANLTPLDQGGYMLKNHKTNAIVIGPRFDADLADILIYLRDANDDGEP